MNEFAEWQKHSQEFYFYVGRCILSYQGVEDMLKFVFSAALHREPPRVDSIYASAEKDLNRKFQFIEIAISARNEQRELEMWTVLKGKIQRAAEKRNTIAHAQPVIYGGGVSVNLEADPPTFRQISPQRWQARKKTKSGDFKIVEVLDLEAFLLEFEQLTDGLREFVDILSSANLSNGMATK